MGERLYEITVPCQDGSDLNCHGEVSVTVTESEKTAFEENDEIPDGAICPACGSDQNTNYEED